MTYITDWALTIALLQELWQGLQQREQKLQSSIIIVKKTKKHLARLICREQNSSHLVEIYPILKMSVCRFKVMQ